jgi:hypothetical protein
LLLSFGNAVKAHDLVAAKRFEKGLEAAVDEAAQQRAVDFHVADSRRALYPLEGWAADETDLNAVCRLLLSHTWQARKRTLD